MQRVYALTPSDFVLLVLLAIVVGYILPRHVIWVSRTAFLPGLAWACSQHAAISAYHPALPCVMMTAGSC